MIASQYLKTENISRIISDFRLKSPISYIVWEDFIDEDIYKSIEREILAEAYVDAREHNDIHRNNKSILLRGKYLQKLFDFFESTTFEKYLSLFVWEKIKQEFYVDRSKIASLMWEDFLWAAAQIYEQGDFFDWHIDGPIEKGSLGAFIYYLGGYEWEWQQSYGGNLELWMQNKAGNIEAYTTIPYKKNTLVFIAVSPTAYHRVTKMQSNMLRLSIQSTIMKQ